MFPDVQTNIWDAVIAVPLIIVLTMVFKLIVKPKDIWVPTFANFLGYGISILISHRHDLAAGIFMGFFYGSAAIGTYSAWKTSWVAFRQPETQIDDKL
ncbi:hypothetical protein [Alkalihalobacillus trypoxylicola]|uniref:Holin n=1 Tax=Alkalihalobacillus trypoxylicola TaxID=519424 RepID=A0A161P6J3_9BACI|nr:hypothetical protein [Alkalihalobacillus trypoxylicola]KYG26651.1 hypothetical protein AZF04_12660 [Alkalihalobacillus trypoxylicola]